MRIVRRDFDPQNRPIREHILAVEVRSRQDGESYLNQQLARGFDSHGYDSGGDYWWGRHRNDCGCTRYFIEA